MKMPRTSPRRCSATPPMLVAPASIASSSSGSTCSGASLIPGISGATRTPVGMPARLSSATASTRARGCGVCASVGRHAFRPGVGTGRHAVQHGARAHLVETGLECLGRVEAAHYRLVAIARQAPLLLPVESEVAPSHEHMFAYRAAGTPLNGLLMPRTGVKSRALLGS